MDYVILLIWVFYLLVFNKMFLKFISWILKIFVSLKVDDVMNGVSKLLFKIGFG